MVVRHYALEHCGEPISETDPRKCVRALYHTGDHAIEMDSDDVVAAVKPNDPPQVG